MRTTGTISVRGRSRPGTDRGMGKATVAQITALLNRTLRVRSIRDASANGLQVKARGTGIISRVGFAVDGCLATFEKAHRAGCGFLVVHHGIRWKGQKDRELLKRREAWLRKHGMALYAVHLPLDLHEEYGNNIRLSRMLGLRQVQRFGRYHGVTIGWAGTLAKPAGLASVASVLNRALTTRCTVHRLGSERIRSLAIVSGGGGDMVLDAARGGIDCFLTGEIDLAAYNTARDYGVNLIAAGHYATETVGVKALMPLVEDAFGVETVFIDDPKRI